MSSDLERRLDLAGDRLPLPSATAGARARKGALAALPSSPATPPTRRRRLRLVGAAAAMGVAVAAVLALVSTFDGTSALTTEKALAAIGELPVTHAVVESERPWATVVDLTTGEERLQVQRTEYWHDAERGLLRARVTVDGQVVSEFVQTREGLLSDAGPVFRAGARDPFLDPALAGFATRYREALESGKAQVIGESEVDGRKVVLMRIVIEAAGPQRQVFEEVELDGDTYRPLRFRFHVGGSAAHWWRVLSIGTLAREQGQFQLPPGPARPQSQTGTDERELTPAQAAHVLGAPALWPGRVVDRIALTKIEVMKLTTRWTDGNEIEGEGLRFEYGGGIFDRVPRWLEIRQRTSRETAPRFGPHDATVPLGRLQLFGFGDNNGSGVDRWIGSLRTQGMFVTLESPEREVVLAAARALVPIDEG